MKGSETKHGPGMNRQGVRNLDQPGVLLDAEAKPPAIPVHKTTPVADPIADEIDRLRRDGVVGSEPMLKHFRFSHLPAPLRKVSRRWAELALATVQECPRNPERTVALRKLLEGKDAAVRSLVPED